MPPTAPGSPHRADYLQSLLAVLAPLTVEPSHHWKLRGQTPSPNGASEVLRRPVPLGDPVRLVDPAPFRPAGGLHKVGNTSLECCQQQVPRDYLAGDEVGCSRKQCDRPCIGRVAGIKPLVAESKGPVHVLHMIGRGWCRAFALKRRM